MQKSNLGKDVAVSFLNHNTIPLYHNRLLVCQTTQLLRCHLSLDRQHLTEESLVDLSKGSHTFDIHAAALEEIHYEYHIREKVTRTTTDSGSNFLKAFRLYGAEKEEEATNVQEESDSTFDDATEDQSQRWSI